MIEILDLNKKVSDKSKEQILFRLTNKLISMSVGRIKLWEKEAQNSHFCWSSGFKLLKENDHIASQLKRLDRNRERQISRIKRKLRDHDVKPKAPKKLKGPKYYGGPFSYHAQFHSKKQED
ncbi:hypothetical protein HYR99_09135 [Candidatus Poribacteria bacterium]|nr:hypothetical protein [Candidatus Poribacteria bacterium]